MKHAKSTDSAKVLMNLSYASVREIESCNQLKECDINYSPFVALSLLMMPSAQSATCCRRPLYTVLVRNMDSF